MRQYEKCSRIQNEKNTASLCGIGRIQSEFPVSQAPDVAARMSMKPADDEMVYADCIEIMLSDEERVE